MSTERVSIIRTRWAAIGAAVAVSLGAGGLSLVNAASGDSATTVLLDAPCRLVDTRPDKGIGGRATPLGAGEEYAVQGTGPSGNCNIPADAIGLITNVTADQASEATNLRLYPTGAAIPTTSNLNPRPGAAPTPNAVTVGLNGSGQFTIRNAKGTVHTIIDVAGYLAHGSSFAVMGTGGSPTFTDDTTLASVNVTAPVAGDVLVNYSVIVGDTAGDRAYCSATTGSLVGGAGSTVEDVSNLRASMSGSIVLPVSAGTTTFNLVCRSVLGELMYSFSPTITAVFIPDTP